MRIAVIGAGIIGVTTAFELAADGHEVTVFERDGGVATGASFAHAGVIAPGHIAPPSSPGLAGALLGHLFGRHAPASGSGWRTLAQLPWLWQSWRACRPAIVESNRRRLHRLARYSRSRLDHLTNALNFEYEQASGVTVLLRSDRELERARPGIKLLSEMGIPFELLDADRTRHIEPCLSDSTPLRASIHLAQDGVGNCRQFAHLLKVEAQRLGAQFRFLDEVRAIRPGAPVQLKSTSGERTFDAVVVCAGTMAAPLLSPNGLRLPLAAVHGYSITAPIRHVDGQPYAGPRSALIDERHRVAISRLGQRVRVAGGAEIGGAAGDMRAPALATLYRVLNDWFPGAAQLSKAQQWKGAMPMLPDGPPVLGASGQTGVWLNLGHGPSGWALAAGSARVLSDLIGRRDPPIDLEGLGVERLGVRT